MKKFLIWVMLLTPVVAITAAVEPQGDVQYFTVCGIVYQAPANYSPEIIEALIDFYSANCKGNEGPVVTP